MAQEFQLVRVGALCPLLNEVPEHMAQEFPPTRGTFRSRIAFLNEVPEHMAQESVKA